MLYTQLMVHSSGVGWTWSNGALHETYHRAGPLWYHRKAISYNPGLPPPRRPPPTYKNQSETSYLRKPESSGLFAAPVPEQRGTEPETPGTHFEVALKGNQRKSRQKGREAAQFDTQIGWFPRFPLAPTSKRVATHSQIFIHPIESVGCGGSGETLTSSF